MTNMTVPSEYNGSGWGVLEQVLVTEELAWACTGITGALGLNAIFGDVFHVAGSPAQKQRRSADCLRASSAPTP